MVAKLGKTQVGGLVGLLWILSPAGAGPKGAPAAGGDPFIAAIETAKRSVASLDCLSVSARNPESSNAWEAHSFYPVQAIS